MVFYLVIFGGLRIPIRRKYPTMNGVQLNVMPIRTGANTLWTAYAITKVVDPVAIFDCKTASPTPSFDKIATTSRPLWFLVGTV